MDSVNGKSAPRLVVRPDGLVSRAINARKEPLVTLHLAIFAPPDLLVLITMAPAFAQSATIFVRLDQSARAEPAKLLRRLANVVVVKPTLMPIVARP